MERMSQPETSVARLVKNSVAGNTHEPKFHPPPGHPEKVPPSEAPLTGERRPCRIPLAQKAALAQFTQTPRIRQREQEILEYLSTVLVKKV
jgi:hypothetical protein